MKKLLISCCFLTALNTQSQHFWTSYPTAQISGMGVNSISIIDANTAWLSDVCMISPSCGSDKSYSVTTNGGTVWNAGIVNLGADDLNLRVANIHGISASVAFAAAYPVSATATGGIWKTIDGGLTWTRQASALFSDASSITRMVYFWNENDGIAMGDSANGYFEIYTTSDSGGTWTRVPISAALIPLTGPDEHGIANNFTVTGNTVWLRTTRGRILKSVDKGLTWTVRQSPLTPGGRGGSMAFTDQNNGLLQSNDFSLYATNDGGDTWSWVSFYGLNRNDDIAAVPGMSNAYVAVGEELLTTTRGSSYSLNGGLNWVEIEAVDPFGYIAYGGHVAMLDEDHGFTSGWAGSPTVGGILKWGGGAMLRLAYLAVSNFKDDNAVTAHPNPTSSRINISAKSISRIEVYDLFGKQLFSNDYPARQNTSIDLENFLNGVYLLKVTFDAGASTIKVVKQ